MPTPMPIMAAISGEKVGTIRTWREQLQQGHADPEAEQRGDDGQAHGDDRAEGQQHDDDGGEDADALARARCRGRGGTDGLPPSSTWKPRCAAACAVVMTFLTAAVGDVGGVGGELDLGEGDVALSGWAIWWAPAGENGLVTLWT